METVVVVQTILLVVVVVILIFGIVILNGIAGKFGTAVDKLLDELRPAVRSIHESVEKLKPSIELLEQKRGDIEKIISEMPKTIANFKEISDSILPITRIISEKTPDIRQVFDNLSTTTNRLMGKADEINARIKPAITTLSGLIQAFAEGIRFFKSVKK